MSYSAILLESGSLDYLLGEEGDPLLLEDHVYDTNYGRLVTTDDYWLLEEDDFALLKEDGEELLVEYYYEELTQISRLACYSYGEFQVPSGVLTSTLANATLISNTIINQYNLGYLDITVGNMVYFTIDNSSPSGPTILGSLGATLRSTTSVSVLGSNDNFGFLGAMEPSGLILNRIGFTSDGLNLNTNTGYVNVFVY